MREMFNSQGRRKGGQRRLDVGPMNGRNWICIPRLDEDLDGAKTRVRDWVGWLRW